MSEPKWTPAQRAAIEDRGGALLVSAAAGSGKTAVLTERAVRLITDPEHPVDADRLLIVTFTNAAAAELRARIGQALLRLSVQQPHNTSPAPPADAAAAGTHLHHRRLLSGPAAQTLSGAGHPAGLCPGRPRQRGGAAGFGAGRNAGKCLPRPGLLRLCRPLR